MISYLKDIPKESLKGKKVLVRVDFNVPVSEGKVADSYRIVRALPTIEYLIEARAKIILVSHIETKEAEVPTLRPVYEYLNKKQINWHIEFLEEYFDDHASHILQNMVEGDVVLLDNVRKYEGEKKNDPAFAESLAHFGEMYVNDAFAVSHRKHASVVGVPNFIPGFVGFLLADEIAHLKISVDTPHPFVFILGGAKFETKLPLIQKFIDKADSIFIGGALVNDVLKTKGYEVGKSLISTTSIDIKDTIENTKLIIPTDVVCKNGDSIETKSVNHVLPEDVILDIGTNTLNELAVIIKGAQYILWNGPLGNYELGFKDATIKLSEMISESDAVSVVGGGDTLASIQELHLEDKFSFISTGGGAMLQYLLDETLPGIEVLDVK